MQSGASVMLADDGRFGELLIIIGPRTCVQDFSGNCYFILTYFTKRASTLFFIIYKTELAYRSKYVSPMYIWTNCLAVLFFIRRELYRKYVRAGLDMKESRPWMEDAVQCDFLDLGQSDIIRWYFSFRHVVNN